MYSGRHAAKPLLLITGNQFPERGETRDSQERLANDEMAEW